jgi:hypothetical protein
MAKLDRLQTLYLDGTVLAASYELRDFLKAAGRPIEVSCVFPIEFQESLYKRPGLFTAEFLHLGQLNGTGLIFDDPGDAGAV